MRKNYSKTSSDYKIIVVDDDMGIIDSLSVILKRNGYNFTGYVNPLEAIERIRVEKFDLLILDFLMNPIHGDKVVEKIREFDTDLYILLLTGHKDLAPPLETIRDLDIQGYCEKSDKFDQLLLLIESGIKSSSQMHTIRRFREGLNNILDLVPKMYQLQPLGSILEEVLAGALPLANSENAFILINDMAKGASEEDKSIFKGIGKFKSDGNYMELIDPTLLSNIELAKTSKKTVQLENEIILPLIDELSQAIGIIYLVSGKNDDSIELLEIFANNATSAIKNASLHSLVNIKNVELSETYEKLRSGYLDTIEALRLAVDAKDVYTRGHSDRVAHYAVKIGMEFGLAEKELEMLRVSGVFHDVGKIGISDDILLKIDRLDEREYDEIKRHPAKGAKILEAISIFRDIAPLVRAHHERVDGKGYPEGLKGDEIPMLARILTVADAFDAMMSDRLYKSRLLVGDAQRQLLEGAGTQFDAVVVEKFVKLIENYDEMVSELAHTYN